VVQAELKRPRKQGFRPQVFFSLREGEDPAEPNSSARQCIPRAAGTSLLPNGGTLRLLNTDVRLGRSLALPGYTGSAGASPSQGIPARQEPRPPRVYRLGGSLALPGYAGSAGASPSQGIPARREPRPPRVCRLGRSLALPGYTGSAGASPSQGIPARREPRPPRVCRLGRSLALPGYTGSAGARPPRVYRLGGSLALPGYAGSAGASPSQGILVRQEPRTTRFTGSVRALHFTLSPKTMDSP